MRHNVPEQNETFFSNSCCPYFPCHTGVSPDQFNCLFCYCPLYTLGSACGGNFTYLENGIKDCSACTIPHRPNGYQYVLEHWPQVSELAKKNRSR